MIVMHLQRNVVIRPNLKLKTRPKQLLSDLQLQLLPAAWAGSMGQCSVYLS